MTLTRMTVGDVLLIPQGEWQFHVVGDVAVGRRLPKGGIVRIRTRLSDGGPALTTHDACLADVCTSARCSSIAPFDAFRLETATGPFGSASFHRGRDFVCVWYCRRPPGLITGVYTCCWDNRTGREYRRAALECESMMLSAVFNRLAWGASDPLTRSLTEPPLAAAEPPPPPPPPPA